MDKPKQQQNTKRSDAFSMIDPPGLQLVRGKSLVAPFSNALYELDVIPRFVRWQNNIVRITELTKAHHEQHQRFMLNGQEYTCVIKPTTVTRKEKTTREEYGCYAWPGEREFLIEKVLFMLASNNGLIPVKTLQHGGVRYGLEFTLYEIFNALTKIGRQRSYDEIREALIILRDSKTIIYRMDQSKKIETTNDIIIDAKLETTGQGKARDSMQVTFSDHITEAILSLEYMQYPFASVHSNTYELSRHIHLFMLINHRNMTENRHIKLMTKSIMESFGKKHLTAPQMRRDMRNALGVLQEQGIIEEFSSRAIRVKQNGQTDHAYNVLPSEELVGQVIQANSKKRGLSTLVSRLDNDPNYQLPMGPAIELDKWQCIKD